MSVNFTVLQSDIACSVDIRDDSISYADAEQQYGPLPFPEDKCESGMIFLYNGYAFVVE